MKSSVGDLCACEYTKKQMRAWPESSRGRLDLEPDSLTTRLIWTTPKKNQTTTKKGEARPKATKAKATKIEDQMKKKRNLNPGLIKILGGARGEMAKRKKTTHLNPLPFF